jgi:hypothetical protein
MKKAPVNSGSAPRKAEFLSNRLTYSSECCWRGIEEAGNVSLVGAEKV